MSDDAVDRILRRDPRYKRAAYEFVIEALRRPASGGHTAAELLETVRLLGIDRFGPLARIVLADWGVSTTEDFGQIVLRLVEEEEMKKTDDDEYSDFVGVFEFADAFPEETGPVTMQGDDEDDA